MKDIIEELKSIFGELNSSLPNKTKTAAERLLKLTLPKDIDKPKIEFLKKFVSKKNLLVDSLQHLLSEIATESKPDLKLKEQKTAAQTTPSADQNQPSSSVVAVTHSKKELLLQALSTEKENAFAWIIFKNRINDYGLTKTVKQLITQYRSTIWEPVPEKNPKLLQLTCVLAEEKDLLWNDQVNERVLLLLSFNDEAKTLFKLLKRPAFKKFNHEVYYKKICCSAIAGKKFQLARKIFENNRIAIHDPESFLLNFLDSFLTSKGQDIDFIEWLFSQSLNLKTFHESLIEMIQDFIGKEHDISYSDELITEILSKPARFNGHWKFSDMDRIGLFIDHQNITTLEMIILQPGQQEFFLPSQWPIQYNTLIEFLFPDQKELILSESYLRLTATHHFFNIFKLIDNISDGEKRKIIINKITLYYQSLSDNPDQQSKKLSDHNKKIQSLIILHLEKYLSRFYAQQSLLCLEKLLNSVLSDSNQLINASLYIAIIKASLYLNDASILVQTAKVMMHQFNIENKHTHSKDRIQSLLFRRNLFLIALDALIRLHNSESKSESYPMAITRLFIQDIHLIETQLFLLYLSGHYPADFSDCLVNAPVAPTTLIESKVKTKKTKSKKTVTQLNTATISIDYSTIREDFRDLLSFSMLSFCETCQNNNDVTVAFNVTFDVLNIIWDYYANGIYFHPKNIKDYFNTKNFNKIMDEADPTEYCLDDEKDNEVLPPTMTPEETNVKLQSPSLLSLWVLSYSIQTTFFKSIESQLDLSGHTLKGEVAGDTVSQLKLEDDITFGIKSHIKRFNELYGETKREECFLQAFSVLCATFQQTIPDSNINFRGLAALSVTNNSQSSLVTASSSSSSSSSSSATISLQPVLQPVLKVIL